MEKNGRMITLVGFLDRIGIKILYYIGSWKIKEVVSENRLGTMMGRMGRCQFWLSFVGDDDDDDDDDNNDDDEDDDDDDDDDGGDDDDHG